MKSDEVPLDSSLGDIAALGKLLDEHRERLVAMVRRRMDPQLARRLDPEEIVSEAYFAAQRRHPELRKDPTRSPYAWLYRLVLDGLVEAYRRETRGKRDLHKELPLGDASSAAVAASLILSGTSPSQAAMRRETADRMQKAFELLSNRDRDILSMRHYDQLSHFDAAEVLGISESAATLRYLRALERLRKLWEQLYGDRELP